MKVLRDDKYLYQGIFEFDGNLFLTFKNLHHPDEIVLCRCAKYIRVMDDAVEYLHA